jgi:hypothetical protein
MVSISEILSHLNAVAPMSLSSSATNSGRTTPTSYDYVPSLLSDKLRSASAQMDALVVRFRRNSS